MILIYQLLLASCLLASTFQTSLGQNQKPISMMPALKIMEGEMFSMLSIDGNGVRIAVLDAGFPNTDTHPAFEHLFKNGKIIKTWNFIKNNKDVYQGHPHGTAVLSCIAGKTDSVQFGLATGAEFLLAVTELTGEPQREELLFAQAIDWAIAEGAQIIQSSLGYSYQRYFNFELNGSSSIAAQAVNKASDKGILFINCAGNEGSSTWKYLDTPADAFHMISIGAIEPETALPASYSSHGPTADGRVKPDLCCHGTTLAVYKNKIRQVSGTSYSTPLVTGFAACLIQMFPDYSLEKIIETLQACGHLYPYFDYAQGYGIPLASRLIEKNKPTAPTFYFEMNPSKIMVNITEFKELNCPAQTYTYLYFNVKEKSGILSEYGIIRVDSPGTFALPINQITNGETVSACFNGYTFTGKKP